jgi:hypothetical protein
MKDKAKLKTKFTTHHMSLPHPRSATRIPVIVRPCASRRRSLILLTTMTPHKYRSLGRSCGWRLVAKITNCGPLKILLRHLSEGTWNVNCFIFILPYSAIYLTISICGFPRSPLPVRIYVMHYATGAQGVQLHKRSHKWVMAQARRRE